MIFTTILSVLLIQVQQLSVTGKSMGTSYWLITKEACPGTVWIGQLTELEMTLMMLKSRKTINQSNSVLMIEMNETIFKGSICKHKLLPVFSIHIHFGQLEHFLFHLWCMIS